MIRGMGDNRESQERPTATRRAFLSASAVTAAAAVPLVGASPALADGGRWSDPPVNGPGRRVGTQRPSAALRRALREIDADRIEADVRRLAAFGTRHTLSTPDRPGARHRRGPRLALRPVLADRRGVRRPDDRREAVVHPAGVAARADPDRDHQRDRHAARHRHARAGLRGDRALRLADHRRHELHRRRTRRRRRRVRRRRPAGAGPGPGGPAARVDPRVRRGRRRGAGPLRLDLHGPDDEGRRHRHPGHVQQRHRRRQPGRRRHPRPAHDPAVRRGRAHLGDAGAGQHPALGRRRERLGVAGSWPASSTRSPTTTTPACMSG